MEYANTIGGRLRALRQTRGLTLADVQRVTGVAPPVLSRLERDEPGLTLLGYADRLVPLLGPAVLDLAQEAAEERLKVRDGVEIEDPDLREAAAELLDRALPAGLLPGVSAVGTSVLKLSPDCLIVRRRRTRVYAGALGDRMAGD